MTYEKLNIWRSVCTLLSDARNANARPLGPSADARWRDLRKQAAAWAIGLADQETFTVTVDEWKQLDTTVRTAIRAGVEPSDAALAAAWGIDDTCWPAFTPHWIDEHDEIFTLADGELYPVDDAQWPAGGSPVTSRPGSLGVRPGELPHVRASEGSTVAITWDATSRVELTAALESTTAMAGVHPASVQEGDDAMQRGAWAPEVKQRALDLVATAAVHANVIVLPELSTDDDSIAALQRQTPPDVLVVGGSRITDVGGGPVNRAPWWVGEMRLEHEKFAPAQHEIDDWGLEPAPPRVTVALAHGWRVSVVICKDLIAPDVVPALTRAGVSLVLVPAWSTRVDAFEAAAASLAVNSQAVSLTVLGPEPDGPVGILGRPFRGRLAVPIEGEPPGYWLVTLDPAPPKYFAST